MKVEKKKVLKCPDEPLKKQVRDFKDTFSAFTVLKDHFNLKLKKDQRMWQVWKKGLLIREGFDSEYQALTWAHKWLKTRYKVKKVN